MEVESFNERKIMMCCRKFCPSCRAEYGEAAIICADCNVKLFNHPSTPDGVLSLKEAIDKFGIKFPDLFYPHDGFYDIGVGTDFGLAVMTQHILKWLKLDDYVSVKFDTSLVACAGSYSFDGKNSSILINGRFRESAFKCGAILAHECMHHYMLKNSLMYSEEIHNEFETDIGVIAAGLGVLAVNGMSKIENGVSAEGGGFTSADNGETSIGYFSPNMFCELFSNYLSAKGIAGGAVIGFIHPDARGFLPPFITSSKASRKLNVIEELEENYSKNWVIKVAIALVVGAIIFWKIHGFSLSYEVNL